MYRSARRYGALDGLRAFAAAAVVWHHCGNHFTGFFGRGVGVTTFFVISGFVITRMLLRERGLTGTVSLRRFWVRRALRILPLYYAVLALYVVLVALVESRAETGRRFWTALPHYATLTTNWFVSRVPGERIIFYFAWSLAVQEQFYLLWPAILRTVRRRVAIALPIFFFLCADISGWGVDAGYLQPGGLHSVLTHLDSPIYLGVVVAFLLDSRIGFGIARALAGRVWSLPLAVALAIAGGSIASVPQPVLELGVAYVVTSCVLAPPRVACLLDNRVMRHIGDVSFGIYLLHMLMINVVRRAMPHSGPGVLFALAFPLSIAVATATRRWLEQPFLGLRDALHGSRELRREAPAPELALRGGR
jgi:peptidoglycan/LPS O-acetylase OafA/YrhL